ncbi:MAG: N-acetylglucosamine-6-phosphate deacetylase [Geminicoccaceae bacterium]|nr:N-acetylglucosamine-6-phosphate deacetylase [Geminicoccaceae bacterium]
MTTRRGCIDTPDGWIAGRIEFEETIHRIEGEPVDQPQAPYLVPGFVDLHVHGGGGADMMSGAEAIRHAARLHARHGTTSLLATTVTAPLDRLEQLLREASAVIGEEPVDRADVPGIHLEGPFVNPGKLGAQPPFAIPADVDVMRRFMAAAPIRVVTVAPECDPGGRMIDMLLGARIVPQIAHSLCDHAMARACIERGCGITHLYNAMTGLDHRSPGIVGAALAYARHAEIIPDLIHVAADAILAARRAIPDLYGVTDATAGAGMPDGAYPLGAHMATKKDGAMRLADGTLAGSALTMDQALRNLVAIGLPLAEAVRRLTTIPAERLGLADRGVLEPGRRADLVVLDRNLSIESVHVAGRRIATRPRSTTLQTSMSSNEA